MYKNQRGRFTRSFIDPISANGKSATKVLTCATQTRRAHQLFWNAYQGKYLCNGFKREHRRLWTQSYVWMGVGSCSQRWNDCMLNRNKLWYGSGVVQRTSPVRPRRLMFTYIALVHFTLTTLWAPCWEATGTSSLPEIVTIARESRLTSSSQVQWLKWRCE